MDEKSRAMGAGLAIGMGIGVALGVAMDNIGAGVGLGAGVGVALGAAMSRQDEDSLARLEARRVLWILLALGMFASLAVVGYMLMR